MFYRSGWEREVKNHKTPLTPKSTRLKQHEAKVVLANSTTALKSACSLLFEFLSISLI
jgi:hypothetical protein